MAQKGEIGPTIAHPLGQKCEKLSFGALPPAKNITKANLCLRGPSQGTEMSNLAISGPASVENVANIATISPKSEKIWRYRPDQQTKKW